MKPSVLVVDDEISVRSVLLELLTDSEYQTVGAESAEAGLAVLAERRYDVVFTDLRMPGMDGIEFLRTIKEKDTTIEVIVLTSHSSFSSAVEALRLGAYDYLIKPLDDIEEVLALVKRVAEKLTLAEEKAQLVEELSAKNREVEESRNQVVKYSEDLTALYSAEQEMMAGLELPEVCGKAVGGLSKLLDERPAILWTVDEGLALLTPAAQSGLKIFEKVAWTFQLFDPTIAGHEGVPPEWQERCRRQIAANTAIFQPVIHRQKLMALLGVFDFKGAAFSPREVDLLARFSASVATAIENARLYAEAKALSIRDGLTGLYNRRYFDEVMTIEGARSLRHQMPVSLIFLDVDYFKHYNDHNGHLMGDGLLKQLATIFLKRVRITDVVCRYGGEEITIILPHTPKVNAAIVAEDLIKRVEAYPFLYRETQPLGAVTISVGIAECPLDSKCPSDIVRMADEALYAAKQAGRNRVCIYTPHEGPPATT